MATGSRLRSAGPAGGNPATAAAASCASTGSRAAKASSTSKSSALTPHHPAALECLQHAYLRDLNHIGHLVRLQATKCTEDRPAVSPGDIETVQRDNV